MQLSHGELALCERIEYLATVVISDIDHTRLQPARFRRWNKTVPLFTHTVFTGRQPWLHPTISLGVCPAHHMVSRALIKTDLQTDCSHAPENRHLRFKFGQVIQPVS
jgi:hypothetical protein